MNEEKIYEFKDVFPEPIKLESLIDKEFLIREWHEEDSQFGEDKKYVVMTIELDGKSFVANTGATAIVKQVKQIGSKLPVRVKLCQTTSQGGNAYFIFRSPEENELV